MKTQIVFRRMAMPHSDPDIQKLNGVVSREVLEAMKQAHAALDKAGIRHALVGALAVGAYGYPRASKDVDFLVGDEAFNHHAAGLVTLRPGIPVEYKGISIDSISIHPESSHLEESVEAPQVSEGIPVAPSWSIVYMKLMSPRRKDAADIVELVASGLDTDPVVRYLNLHAPELLDKFGKLVDEAEED